MATAAMAMTRRSGNVNRPRLRSVHTHKKNDIKADARALRIIRIILDSSHRASTGSIKIKPAALYLFCSLSLSLSFNHSRYLIFKKKESHEIVYLCIGFICCCNRRSANITNANNYYGTSPGSQSIPFTGHTWTVQVSKKNCIQ